MKSGERGAYGEALVAAYLRRRGYTVTAANYRCRYGEIDLIARDGDILCFIEVKLRSDTAHGLPRESVTAAKRARLRTTAEFYLAAHELDCPARFDVAEVYTDGDVPRIEYIENAF